MVAREIANTKTLLASRVDGILVSISKETDDFKHLYNLKNNGILMVFYVRVIPGFNADQVIIDDFDTAYRTTKHLVESGRKRIAHFAGPQNLLIGQYRKDGYLKAINEAGLGTADNLIFEADNFESARLAVLNILDNNIKIDGLFAVNDLTAIGAMQSLQKRGVKFRTKLLLQVFPTAVFQGLPTRH